MAIINYSPWADAANVGQGLGASLTNLMLELPKLRQQQQLMAMHQQLYGAQAGLYDAEAERNRAQIPVYGAETAEYKARAGLLGAQTTEITSAEKAKDDLWNAFLNISNAQQSGQPIGPHVSNAVNALARIPHKDRASLAETLAQMLEMDKPATRRAIAVGNNTLGRPINVGPGATVVNPDTQEPIYQSPRVLGYGQELHSPENGDLLATGRDRPLSDVIHSAVSGAIARAYFDPNITSQERTNILSSVPGFLQSLPGAGMPTKPLPIVPGRGTTNAPVNPRFNPATEMVERFNPTTQRWESR